MSPAMKKYLSDREKASNRNNTLDSDGNDYSSLLTPAYDVRRNEDVTITSIINDTASNQQQQTI